MRKFTQAVLFLILLTSSAALAGETGSTVAEPAVLLVPAALAGHDSGRMTVDSAVEIIAGMFSVGPPAGGALLWPRLETVSGCGDSDPAAGLVEAGIERGRHLFFREMDTAAAVEELGNALSVFFERPCLRQISLSASTAACRGAVLQTRLLLMLGRAETAVGTVQAAVNACSEEDLSAEDVPPEVRRFIESVQADASSGRQGNGARVIFECPGGCDGLYVDGRALGATGTRVASTLAAGRHRIDLVESHLSGDSFRRTWLDFEGVPARIVIAPGPSLAAWGKGVFLVEGDLHEAARVLAGILDVPAVGISNCVAGQCLSILADHGGLPSGRLLAEIVPADDGVEFLAPSESPLEMRPRRPWPWPWVAGGVSAGFLAAGIALNVMQYRTVDSDVILSGKYRDAAIAGYSTAGAGLLAAILLAVLRPEPDRSVLVAPTASGFSLVFRPGRK